MSKVNRFQVVGYSLIVLLFTVTCNLSTVRAADSTPSADIRDRLEELKKEVASKAAKLKQEVAKKLNNKSYAGNLKSISLNSLTLASDSGPKLIIINQDTVYESSVKTKTKFSRKTLSEEAYIAALGDVDETGVLLAKKIILLPTPNSQLRTYQWGQIVSSSEKLFTLQDKDGKNIAMIVPPGSKAKLHDVIIATGKYNKNEIFESEFVFVTNKSQTPNKTASPSASLKPSPIKSGPTSTPKATPKSAKSL